MFLCLSWSPCSKLGKDRLKIIESARDFIDCTDFDAIRVPTSGTKSCPYRCNVKETIL